MRYLSSYKLFENARKSKSILESLCLDINDDVYEKISKILEKNLEHINDFSDILIEELNYLENTKKIEFLLLLEKKDKWTPENIRQEIKDGGYVDRKDLLRNNKNLYQAALIRNMLDEFFDRERTKWTPERIRQEITDGNYVNKSDLKRNNKNLYQAALGKKMLDEFFDTRTPTPGKIRAERTEWTTEKIREQIIAGDYKSKSELERLNINLYNAALKYGVLYEFFDKNGDKIKWTEEKIRQEIIDGDYESRYDLEKKNKNLYRAALGRNMLDEFFDPHKWTPEKIRKEIKDGDYTGRWDLFQKNKNLYDAAWRNNMLDEFFDKNKK